MFLQARIAGDQQYQKNPLVLRYNGKAKSLDEIKMNNNNQKFIYSALARSKFQLYLIASNLSPVTAAILDTAATLSSKLATSRPNNVTTPTKLAEAYNSLTKTIGISFTNTSRSIPPPIAISRPENAIARKFRPNKLCAKVVPITVKTQVLLHQTSKIKFGVSKECGIIKKGGLLLFLRISRQC